MDSLTAELIAPIPDWNIHRDEQARGYIPRHSQSFRRGYIPPRSPYDKPNKPETPRKRGRRTKRELTAEQIAENRRRFLKKCEDNEAERKTAETRRRRHLD